MNWDSGHHTLSAVVSARYTNAISCGPKPLNFNYILFNIHCLCVGFFAGYVLLPHRPYMISSSLMPVLLGLTEKMSEFHNILAEILADAQQNVQSISMLINNTYYWTAYTNAHLL